jgi:hypothetical protein
MLARRLRLELALVPRIGLVAAPLILLAFAGLGALTNRRGVFITVGLEAAVPLAAGLAAASLLADEPSLELRISLPGGVRSLAVWRLGLQLATTALVCLVGWIMADAIGLLDAWLPDVSPLLAQLTWLAPLVLLTMAGACLAVVLRSRTAAAGILAGGWLLAQALHDVALGLPALRVWFPFLTSYEPGATDWLPTRLLVLAIGLAAAVLLGWLLGDGERLIGAEDAT